MARFSVGKLNHHFIKNKDYTFPIFDQKNFSKSKKIEFKFVIIENANISEEINEDIFKYQFPKKSKIYLK